jgi:hypothetical protein
VLRVERVDPLRAQDRVEHQEADEVEEEHGSRIALPVLLAAGVRPEGAVQQPLERPEDAVEHDRLALVDARHVAPEQRDARGQHRHEHDDLQPGGRGHLQALPAQQRVQEVHGDQDRDGERDGLDAAHIRRSPSMSAPSSAKHAMPRPSEIRSMDRDWKVVR